MVFERVVVGIDGTRASFEAGRQAARLTAPGGRLLLVAVADPYLAMFNRWGAGRLVQPGEVDDASVLGLATERIEARALESLQAMRGQLPEQLEVRETVVKKRSWDAIRETAADEGADLVALGSHGGTRLGGLALGSTTSELIHDAPCATLVARPPFDPPRFPASIVVGVDGSPESLVALDVAKSLARSADGPVVAGALCAGEDRMDPDALARMVEPLRAESRHGRAVDTLVEASSSADLLIVGARGLRGARALGSVSERVAHRAECSVLILRGTR